MPKINNITIPTSIATRGAYRYAPPAIIHVSGSGAAVTAVHHSIEWVWSVMDETDYTWWHTTLLGGAASGTFTSTNELPDEFGVEQTYAEVTVSRIEYGRLQGGYFHNVTARLTMLV